MIRLVSSVDNCSHLELGGAAFCLPERRICEDSREMESLLLAARSRDRSVGKSEENALVLENVRERELEILCEYLENSRYV